MEPVGLANTRISTVYAQKSPRSLVGFSPMATLGPAEIAVSAYWH